MSRPTMLTAHTLPVSRSPVSLPAGHCVSLQFTSRTLCVSAGMDVSSARCGSGQGGHPPEPCRSPGARAPHGPAPAAGAPGPPGLSRGLYFLHHCSLLMQLGLVRNVPSCLNCNLGCRLLLLLATAACYCCMLLLLATAACYCCLLLLLAAAGACSCCCCCHSLHWVCLPGQGSWELTHHAVSPSPTGFVLVLQCYYRCCSWHCLCC